MTKIKTCEATDAALDLLVSRANNPPGRDGWGWFERDGEGFLFDPLNECRYSPSTIWAQGGPIIEREGVTVSKEDGCWSAYFRDKLFEDDGSEFWSVGPTPLIAAARCYVASKLGAEVEIPEELL